MSDARAIEAVTETLRSLVDIGVKQVESAGVAVARPPDRVGDAQFDMMVNLFLFEAVVEGSLRNEPPFDLAPGETGQPALPLVLHYLVTPYVKDGNDVEAHRMLGGAVRILHEHSWLTRADLAAIAPYSNVSQQVDQIRITGRGIDEKDIYSLWSSFQTPYRLSAAFEVRAVLIDSRVGAKTPLPVLTRGSDDRGPQVRGDVVMPFPTLKAAVAAGDEPSALPGERVTLEGHHLSDLTSVEVRLTHPLVTTPVTVTPVPTDVADTAIVFELPQDATSFPAGFYSVAVVYTDATGDEQGTNEVPLAVAPRITSAMPITVGRNANGTAVVSLDVEPEVQVGQLAQLLLGDRSVKATTITQPSGTLEFRVGNAAPDTYAVRLRVAGIDTRLVDRSTTPPTFDPDATVTVTG
jgi:hypothetical protein